MQETSIAVDNKEYIEPSKYTVESWGEIWLRNHCTDLKYKTKKTYRAQFENHIKPALGEVKLSELTTEKIQAFYNSLNETGKTTIKKTKSGKTIITKEPLSPKSIKNVHCVLSKMLNDAVDLKYLKFNASSKTKRPKTPKYDFVPLSDDDIRAFLTALETEQHRLLYLTYLFTGMRESEALGLSWNCVDLKKGILKVSRQLEKRPLRDGGYTISTVKN